MRYTVMVGSSVASLQLLTDQFRTATGDWCRIAEALQTALRLPDDSLLSERPASKFIWSR